MQGAHRIEVACRNQCWVTRRPMMSMTQEPGRSALGAVQLAVGEQPPGDPPSKSGELCGHWVGNARRGSHQLHTGLHCSIGNRSGLASDPLRQDLNVCGSVHYWVLPDHRTWAR
jgi:hypothetical protein